MQKRKKFTTLKLVQHSVLTLSESNDVEEPSASRSRPVSGDVRVHSRRQSETEFVPKQIKLNILLLPSRISKYNHLIHLWQQYTDLYSILAGLVTQSKIQEQSCRFCKDNLLSIRIFLSRFLELFLHMSKIAGIPVVTRHYFLIQIH